MQGVINLLEAFEASRADIARGVNRAIERVELQDEASICLATAMRLRDNGSVSLYQLGNTVTLTAGQVAELMGRIKAVMS
jgi:hypothetical protein